jgi:hypothetical protein
MAKKRQPTVRAAEKTKKLPKIFSEPETRKIPNMPIVRGGHLAWRFSSTDVDGPFAWNSEINYTELVDKLKSFETMTDTDIRQQGSHPIQINKLSKLAQNRLSEIKHDDIDELMSFRLNGVQRVWCRIIGSVMCVLWWDPEHQVCPSQLKNT